LPPLQPTPIAAGNYLPESDPAVNQLRVHGVDGQVVTELKMGGQLFAVVDVSKCPQVQGGYYPFSRRDAVKDGTPNLWKFAEGDRPLVLMHYDESGAMVGRALRADSPMLIGREAAAKDPGASRFNLGHDDTVSRDHASIVYDKATDRIIVTDRESTNGTRVRQVTPDRQQAAVPEQPQPAPADPYEHVTIPDESSEMPLTKEIMELGDLVPEQKVRAGDREFYVSKVIDGRYDMAVLYTTVEVDGKPRVAPRLLYKSQSDGGWRATYGIEGSGRFVKEADGQDFNHYTQETKLHPDIVDALEQARTVPDPDNGKLKKIVELFKETSQAAAETNTSKSEIRYSRDPAVDGKLAPLRLVSAGYLSDQDLARVQRHGAGTFAEYYRSLDQVFAELPGFVPDFTAAPRETRRREHTLLGEITVEDYDATINGQPLVWSMATDRQGRVWIDNIHFADSPTSSYGTYAKVFDGGLLTNKPLEYRSQLNGVRPGEWNGFNNGYADITPLIGQLLPVRQYRQAKLAR
jgi:hypothetical protein